MWYDSVTGHVAALGSRAGHPNLKNWLRGAPYDGTHIQEILKMRQILNECMMDTKEKMTKCTYIVQDKNGEQRAKSDDGFKALKHIQGHGSKDNPPFVEINCFD